MRTKCKGNAAYTAACAAVILILLLCIVLPLCRTAMEPRLPDVVRVMRSARWRTAALHTAATCVSSTALSVLIGFLYALSVERADIPLKPLFAALPVVHLVTPPFVGGLSFILLLGRQGFVTKTLLHLDVSLYGFPGLLIAQTLCFFPIAYLICAETLRSIPEELELVARSMGSSPWHAFRTVTLPLSAPGITASALFIAVSVLSDFGNPLIVAGRYRVLATEIYTQLTGWLNAGTSAVLGIFLLVPSAVLFVLYNRTLRKNSRRLAVLGGKTGTFRTVRRAKAPLPARAAGTLFCAIVGLIIASQFASIAAGSVQTLWSVNAAPTVRHLQKAISYLADIRSTLIFSAASAALGTVVASFAAYSAQRGGEKRIMPHIVDMAIQLPAAIPGSLMGLSLALTAASLRLHAPHVLITCAMMIAFMPFSYRIMTDSLLHIRTTLDDGARSLGAGRLKVFTSVLMPLCSGGAFYSFAYSFIRGTGTLSSVIFLVSFNTPLASVRILNLAEQGDWGGAAALSLILTAIIFVVLAAAGAAGRRRAERWKR